MGTTQRIIPGVTGEPNWSNLSNSITALANTTEKELEASNQADDANDKLKDKPTKENQTIADAIAREQIKLNARRNKHFKNALKSLIRTGGGKNNVVKGKSSSIGKAGIRVSSRISGFVTNVYDNGLESTLVSIGFGSIKGKSLTEVIDFLLVYFADESAGMDDVAANMASCQLLEILSENLTTVDELEEKLNSLIEEENLTELICTFYGIYLFEHLSQRFQEKITQLKGETVSRETFKLIKEDIVGQVKKMGKDRSIININWKGSEGKDIQEKIFNSIIQLFE